MTISSVTQASYRLGYAQIRLEGKHVMPACHLFQVDPLEIISKIGVDFLSHHLTYASWPFPL